VLYGPHGSGAVPGGPESNRVMSGSPDGLPARPKHGTTQASGLFPTVPGRAHARPKSVGLVPTHLTQTNFFGIVTPSPLMPQPSAPGVLPYPPASRPILPLPWPPM
jgi:hypothetical protein